VSLKTALIVMVVYFFCAVSAPARAKTIWRDRNVYSSGENLAVGDILTVNVNDISSLRFDLSLSSSSGSKVSSNPDMTITGFLPKIASGKNISSSDATRFSGKNQLVFSIASTVRNRTRGGKYTIAGARTYSFSGVTSTGSVSGLVDPVLVKGRSVDSGAVADFRIEIQGRKEGITLKREALKAGEKPEVNLTDEEQRKIIIDYLENMIREITK